MVLDPYERDGEKLVLLAHANQLPMIDAHAIDTLDFEWGGCDEVDNR